MEKITGIINKKGKILNIFKWIYTMFFVIVGWVIFRSDSLKDALVYLQSMFSLKGINAQVLLHFKATLMQSLTIFVIGFVSASPLFKKLGEVIKPNLITNTIYVLAITLIFVLSVASLVSNSYNPFIYFNF